MLGDDLQFSSLKLHLPGDARQGGVDSFPPSGQPNLRGLLQREALGGPNLLGRFRPISFRHVGFRTFMRDLDQALGALDLGHDLRCLLAVRAQ